MFRTFASFSNREPEVKHAANQRTSFKTKLSVIILVRYFVMSVHFVRLHHLTKRGMNTRVSTPKPGTYYCTILMATTFYFTVVILCSMPLKSTTKNWPDPVISLKQAVTNDQFWSGPLGSFKKIIELLLFSTSTIQH